MTREETDWLNQSVSLYDLVQEYYGIALDVGFTTVCPFHRDTRKSAKTFADNCLYCFTERKSYRPYDVLVANGFDDDAIRKTYSIPKDLKAREAWTPPPEYRQAVDQLRREQRTVEEVMRVWEFIVGLMETERKGTVPNVQSA